MSFEVGDVVIAIAGRDKDLYFVVVDIIDELYVLISNGKTRRLDKPKKKKVKHLSLVKKADNEFVSLKEHKKVTNSALRKHIEKIIQQIEQN